MSWSSVDCRWLGTCPFTHFSLLQFSTTLQSFFTWGNKDRVHKIKLGVKRLNDWSCTNEWKCPSMKEFSTLFFWSLTSGKNSCFCLRSCVIKVFLFFLWSKQVENISNSSFGIFSNQKFQFLSVLFRFYSFIRYKVLTAHLQKMFTYKIEKKLRLRNVSKLCPRVKEKERKREDDFCVQHLSGKERW